VRVIEIHGGTGDSTIVVGGDISNLPVPAGDAFIITDTIVRHYYQRDFPPCEVIEIRPGESRKNLDTVKDIYEQLVKFEADRSSFIVGIGGGVVCDIAGFVASTFMRGLRFGLVPSTLLSQADAGVGGKNGVNLSGHKNMVGVFNQPEFVFCDMNLLKTLPRKELLCGFAEIAKHAAIADPGLFSYLERNDQRAFDRDTRVMEKLVHDSIIIKSAIVNRDEKEKGERRKLNFGHTIGHAIEKTTRLSHGQAVSVGMAFAARLSEKRGYLSSKDRERIEGLLERLGLPVRIPIDGKSLLPALRMDKKRQGDRLYFVLLKGIGDAVVEELPIHELEIEIIQACHESKRNQK
jgi:3-dehydroquinate synthase